MLGNKNVAWVSNIILFSVRNKIILITTLADYLLVLSKNSLILSFFSSSENKKIILTCLEKSLLI